MQNFLKQLKQKAIKLNKKIIFPECEDLRTLDALQTITKEKLCQPILIGNKSKIIQLSLQQNFKINFSKCEFIDPTDSKLLKKFSQQLFKLRQKKGLTLDQAEQQMQDINYFAVMCLHNKLGDGLVSGATSSTASTLRPAFQIIRTKKPQQLASGCFMMVFPDRAIFFADCAVNPSPTAPQLAQIAADTAITCEAFGFKPKIAMLSFSTHGSAHHPLADKVAQATKIFTKKYPKILIDGEIQADVALVQSVAKFKSPKSKIKGDANIMIFPDLQAGNIGYKIVERLAKAEAIGTIIQGLKKTCNDLSRGCKASDIVYLTAITAIQIAHPNL